METARVASVKTCRHWLPGSEEYDRIKISYKGVIYEESVKVGTVRVGQEINVEPLEESDGVPTRLRLLID